MTLSKSILLAAFIWGFDAVLAYDAKWPAMTALCVFMFLMCLTFEILRDMNDD